MGARPVSQLGMDETVIEDDVVEEALETRQKAKDGLSAVRQRYEDAHEKAVQALQRLEMPTGTVVRVGRFRIEKRHVAAGSVAFERRARDRTFISVPDEGRGRVGGPP